MAKFNWSLGEPKIIVEDTSTDRFDWVLGKADIIYAPAAAAAGTNMEINIGDAWKDVDKLEINIGDAWKDVTKVQLNVGDTWKTIFEP